MKQRILISTLGFALIISAAWVPSQKVSAVSFTSPDKSSPNKSTGGASRGGLFTPKEGESTLNEGTGGASRGLFTPEEGESTLNRGTTGGASRGLFTPDSRQPAPEIGTSSGGGSRGLFTPDSRQPAPEIGTSSGGGSRGELFAPDSRQPAPEIGTSGGGSREGRRYLNLPNTTPEEPAAILALLPQSYFGTTISQRAEILVYVPRTQAIEGVFSLKDAEGNTVHEMNVPISGRSEVISIKVPTELKLEKNYQWFLALKIDGELTTRTPYVDGWIKRITPNREIAASMQQGDLLKQAEALGKHGVWYDCVATLAKLRTTQPNNTNLDKEWSELLESVELQQIEKAPIVASNFKS
ncbi:protein of unknown function (DUF928) [Rivularia sp. PCC 7116]|uniref:DUF928 domain-containing protein n=1 Tax=Rivularia sp. PCC 7116 TaxID=373994 RepID=UPI00029F2A9A|nr:DUF928 domain-containing protein [Rivularia sp. PCC 7116]AFY54836.1 protein of unknown function (DUF928) [Rivularia sp. PCC 7116]